MSENKKINLYQKLQNVRVELQKMDLKKSGLNKFSGFSYFELKDFLPQADTLMQKYNLFAYDEIDTENAVITVVDCEDTESLPFQITMPSTVVELKGATPIQCLGSVQTYMRRYLYVALLNIVESDLLDNTIDTTSNTKSKPKTPSSKKPTDANNPLVKMKKLCTDKNNEGKKDQVVKILDEKAKVKNPNAIKDEKVAEEIIIELEKI